MSDLEVVFVALNKKDIENINNALSIVEEESTGYENPLTDSWFVTQKRFIALTQLMRDPEKTEEKDLSYANALIKVQNLFVIDWLTSDPFYKKKTGGDWIFNMDWKNMEKNESLNTLLTKVINIYKNKPDIVLPTDLIALLDELFPLWRN